MIKIYTDGSCLGNPGKGGWAAIILEDEKKILCKYYHLKMQQVMITINLDLKIFIIDIDCKLLN